MKKKCKYCSKIFNQIQADILEEYCSGECMKKSNSFYLYYKKYKLIFYLLISISIILLLFLLLKLSVKA